MDDLLDILKTVSAVLLGIVCFLVVILSFTFTIVYCGQYVSYNYSKGYKYKVIQDNIYWYTNKVEKTGNSITFINNYGTKTTYNEKYQIDENVWNKQKPSLTTVYFGY